jgi:hypothetical protein
VSAADPSTLRVQCDNWEIQAYLAAKTPNWLRSEELSPSPLSPPSEFHLRRKGNRILARLAREARPISFNMPYNPRIWPGDVVEYHDVELGKIRNIYVMSKGETATGAAGKSVTSWTGSDYLTVL